MVAFCRYNGGMAKVTFRLPDDLHERLVEAAEEDRRSLNGEILVLVEWALDERSHEEVRG